MQPDREDAERDDAAVEVAAHRFFVSLSRGFLRSANAVCPSLGLLLASAVSPLGQDLVLCGIFGPINAREVMLSCYRSHTAASFAAAQRRAARVREYLSAKACSLAC